MVTTKQRTSPGVVIPTGSEPLPKRYLAGLDKYLGLAKPLAARDVTLEAHFENATNLHYCGVRSALVSRDTVEFYFMTSIARTTIANVSFFGPEQAQYKLLLNAIPFVQHSKSDIRFQVIADVITRLFFHPLFPQLRMEAVLTPITRMKLVKGDQWIILPTVRTTSAGPYVLFSDLQVIDNPDVVPKLGRFYNPSAPRWNTRVIERQPSAAEQKIRISKLASVKPKAVLASVEKAFDPDAGITTTDV